MYKTHTVPIVMVETAKAVIDVAVSEDVNWKKKPGCAKGFVIPTRTLKMVLLNQGIKVDCSWYHP